MRSHRCPLLCLTVPLHLWLMCYTSEVIPISSSLCDCVGLWAAHMCLLAATIVCKLPIVHRPYAMQRAQGASARRWQVWTGWRAISVRRRSYLCRWVFRWANSPRHWLLPSPPCSPLTTSVSSSLQVSCYAFGMHEPALLQLVKGHITVLRLRSSHLRP